MINISDKLIKLCGFILLLLLPQISYALSGENMAYMGVSNNGKVINAQYQSGPNEENNWVWFFGDEDHDKYKTCWTIKKNDISYFTCADKYNGKTTVQYKSLSQQNEQYSEAMKVYKNKFESCEKGVMSKFVCETGCANHIPKYIFEIGFSYLACSEEELKKMGLLK